MKKIVLIYGGIGGLIIAAMLFITMPMAMEGKMENGELIGYTTMVIALSTIFVGVKMYRDKHLGGIISFGKAFLVGLYITLVASFLYATGWELYLAIQGISGNEFMEYYTQCQADQLEKSGASADKIARMKEQSQSFMTWYNNPVLRFLWTMMIESFPVGLIVALITAAILKKKPQTVKA